MKYDLYPYNFYILLGCCLLVILFLFISLSHLSKLARSMQKQAQGLERCVKVAEKAQRKQDAIRQKHAENHKYDAYKKAFLPFALAVFMIYRENDAYKGIKGYKNAAKDVVTRNFKLSQFEYLLQHFTNF